MNDSLSGVPVKEQRILIAILVAIALAIIGLIVIGILLPQ